MCRLPKKPEFFRYRFVFYGSSYCMGPGILVFIALGEYNVAGLLLVLI